MRERFRTWRRSHRPHIICPLCEEYCDEGCDHRLKTIKQRMTVQGQASARRFEIRAEVATMVKDGTLQQLLQENRVTTQGIDKS